MKLLILFLVGLTLSVLAINEGAKIGASVKEAQMSRLIAQDLE